MNLSVNKINVYDDYRKFCRVFPVGGYATSTAQWFNARYFK